MKTFLRPLSLAAIAAVTLLTAAGCSQTSIVPAENSGKAIRFEPVTERSVDTKAPITTISNMNDFRVVASKEGNSGFDEIGNYLFDRVIVSKNDDGTWGYNPVVLWPSDLRAACFYAWSPARSPYTNFASHPIDGTPGFIGDGQAKLYYRVPADITAAGVQQQEDLLVAQTDEISPNNTVRLQFQHALSRVVFRARSEVRGMNFYVKEVQLCNLFSEDVLDMADGGISPNGPLQYAVPYGDQDKYLHDMWGRDPKNRLDYKVSLPGGSVYVPYNITTPTAFTELHASTNALMVIPQETKFYDKRITESATKPAADKLLLKLTYNIVGSQSADKTVYLNVCKPGTTDKDFVFEMGRQYNFNISITDSGVQYTVALSDWNVAAPEVPVPARGPFAVGDQFKQNGFRGIVSAIDNEGKATHIYQIVPLPKNPGTLINFNSSVTDWIDLDIAAWTTLWDQKAYTDEQRDFSAIWKPAEAVEYAITTPQQSIIDLMAELNYKAVATSDMPLALEQAAGTWAKRELYNETWGNSGETLDIKVNPVASTKLENVELSFSAGNLSEVGILVETVLPYPEFKVQ